MLKLRPNLFKETPKCVGIDSKNIGRSKNYPVQIRKSVEQTIALLRTPTTRTTRIREHFKVPDLSASMAAVPVAHFPSENVDVQSIKKQFIIVGGMGTVRTAKQQL